MHDATGVDTADPMLVDYLLAKVDTPLREALLRRYQGQQRPFKDYKERSCIMGGLRAIRAVIVKDTISVSDTLSTSINSRAFALYIRLPEPVTWRSHRFAPAEARFPG